MSMELDQETPDLCLNCEKPLPPNAKFCPHCGQKNNNGKVRMKELLKRFWSHFSHLDSKVVRAIWQLMIPGKVTVEYFKGKHKKYPHPVQFFFVVMFFFLLVFNKQIGDKGFSFNNLGNNFNFSFNPTEKEDKAEITSEMVLESLKYSAKKHSYLRAYNQLPADLKNKETERALDSVLSTVYKKENRNLVFVQHVTDSIALSNGDSINLSNDSVEMNLLTFKSKIALDDLFNQTPDEIIENYGVNGWMEQILLKQSLKSFKNPQGLVHTYIGSFAWTILALIGLMALILHLFYYRQKRYYVEHFVFLMHQHSGAYLMLTLALLLSSLFPLGPIWIVLLGWIGISMWLALYNYYRQSWWMTTLKWLMYVVIYVIGFGLLFTISLLLALFLF
jgi:hypothetical protein